MTILSLGAYANQLKAIRTMAETFSKDTKKGSWVVPHATQTRITLPSRLASPASSLKTIGKEDGPVATMEVLVETSHDNVGGQGYSGSTLWSDGQTSHVVTMDVENLIQILDGVFGVIKKLPGLKDAKMEDILLHVNDFNSTSALTRADPQFTPNFGAQCMFICPTGRVLCLTFDRVSITSATSNKYAWRGLSIKEGHELALMKASPAGFDYDPADGYICAAGVRLAYFIREFPEISLTKPVSCSYAWAKTDTDTVMPTGYVAPTLATIDTDAVPE
jgi:hypothetical protein